MTSFIFILILIWAALSAIVILFVVVLSSRSGRDEMDINYTEEYEDDVKEASGAVDINDPCAQI